MVLAGEKGCSTRWVSFSVLQKCLWSLSWHSAFFIFAHILIPGSRHQARSWQSVYTIIHIFWTIYYLGWKPCYPTYLCFWSQQALICMYLRWYADPDAYAFCSDWFSKYHQCQPTLCSPHAKPLVCVLVYGGLRMDGIHSLDLGLQWFLWVLCCSHYSEGWFWTKMEEIYLSMNHLLKNSISVFVAYSFFLDLNLCVIITIMLWLPVCAFTVYVTSRISDPLLWIFPTILWLLITIS